MIRKIAASLSILLLVCVVIPMDSQFFGRILQPDPAFAQDGLALEDFALYSHKEIKLDNIGESRGNVGSNGSIDIKKGASGSVIGSIQAVGDIKTEAELAVYGDVTARIIEDKGSLSVSGQKIERSDLVLLSLPDLQFSSTGPDLEVPETASMTIAPGSYGRFKVKKGAAVTLSSGAYYFTKFEVDESAAVHLDVSIGAIVINVTEKIKFKKNVAIQIFGGNSNKVFFNFRGADKVEVEDHAVLRGILIAPSAKVEFKKGSRLEGAAYADSIHLAKGASFRHYAASADGRPPTADAGGYQTVLTGGPVELDGSGSSDPDGDPLTYHWSLVSFPEGAGPALSDPAGPMPAFTADRVGVYVIELSVGDGTYTSLKDTATVTAVSELLDVSDFVLYADDKIKMDEISGGEGHLGANRQLLIEKGPSGPIAGDLRVPGYIKNNAEINIAGDVITNSSIDDHGTLTVTGMIVDHAALAPRTLPRLSFSAEGPDLKVAESAALDLVPGTYGRVEVKKGAVLQFTSGSYFLRELETGDSGSLVFDASEGTVVLNVVKKLGIGKDADLRITEGGTRDVLINYIGKKEVEIEDRSVFRGTLVAPGARVEFEKDSRLEGAVYAKQIHLDKGVGFYYHENRPPVADTQTVFTLEDTPTSFALGGSDRDGDSLVFAVSTQPLHGTLEGTAPDLIYTPDINFNGSDAFSFTVNDGSQDSEPATVSISVAAVNDAPVAIAQTISLNEDEPKPLLLSGIDVEGDAISYEIVAQPANGALTGTLPDLIYTPFENYNGADRFTFKANDAQVDSRIAAVSITINPVNDTPVALADNVTTDEDEALAVISVLANDTDVDGDTLLVTGFGTAGHGTVEDNGDGTCSYSPEFNFHGKDTFSYTISDGHGVTVQANVTVTVNPVNDAPVAVDDALITEEDTAVTVAILANDTDADGDSLVIANVSQGANGAVSTNPNGTITYAPNSDFNGSDSFTYSIEDLNGGGDTATVNISVNPVNDAPIAAAGPNQAVFRADTVDLDGSASSDVDGDALSFQWSFLSRPAKSTAPLSDASAANPSFVPDIAGAYALQLIVSDGNVASSPDTVVITASARMVTVPDVVGQLQPDAEASLIGATLTVGVISTAHSGSVAIDRVISQSSAAGAFLAEGSAVDLLVSLGPEIPAPSVTLSASPAEIQPGGSATLSWTSDNAQSAYIDNGIGSVGVNDSVTVAPAHTTTFTLSVTGAGGTASKSVTIAVLGLVEPQPEGSYGEQYEGLIPPDAAVDRYDPKRFSIITGKVEDPAGAAISGVSITVHSHPEYGSMATDSQGKFYLPVEGGGTLTVNYRKEGLIPIHRKVRVPWNDIAIADTVVMIAHDPLATTLSFDGNPNTVVTHKSTAVVDASGTRALTMVLTGDNQAYLVDENNADVQQLPTITTRATEYTTPESMPARLPPTSAFTYCAELQVDGAERVRFEKPVAIWVDNFLDFADGVAVPVGYYDRDKGVWVPLDNGVVVRLLDTEPAGSPDGKVDALDADGDGLPDDLDGNGSFSNEVQGLDDAQKYAAGATFWRAAVTHFSPIDLNFPFGAPPGAIGPNPKGIPQADTQKVDESDAKRHICSFVEEKSRIFHEDIPVPGTDLTLHYATNRVDGFEQLITVAASGDSVPDNLVKIIVKINVAGRNHEVELPPAPNQTVEIEWDGKDFLGRSGSGQLTASIRIGFVYNGVYYLPANLARAFGQPGIRSLIVPTRQPVVLWRDTDLTLHINPGKGTIAEGWTLSSHHFVTPEDPTTLFKGDGSIYQIDTTIITTVAGDGTTGFKGDGGPATKARLSGATDLAIDNLGNLYISDHQNHRIRQVDTNGIISTLAGNGYFRPFAYTNGIDVDDSGNIYVTGGWNDKVYKVTAGGVIKKVAGGGYGVYVGDGGPATAAYLYYPTDVAADRFGNIYINSDGYIRKVDASGIITTLIKMPYARGIDVDDSGNIYVADGIKHRIRRVDANGKSNTIAGNRQSGYSGDGGLATDAMLSYPGDVAVDRTGNLFIADTGNNRIRKMDNQGIISTVAGNGKSGYSGDGGPALDAQLYSIHGIDVDDSGNLYIACFNHIRKVGKIKLPVLNMDEGDLGFPEKAGIGHVMDASGRHKRTVDLNTGAVLNEFGYDPAKKLVSITDQFGSQIAIERDTDGVPTAIISPDGVRTELTIDADNHLTRINYPDGSYYTFDYTVDGLLTLKTQPEGNQFGHIFDSNGRITDFTDDEGGHWQFFRNVLESGDLMHETLTGESNLTSYTDSSSSNGSFASTIIEPSGGQRQFTRSDDGLSEATSFSCGGQLEIDYDYDSEYKFKYVKERKEIMPSGLQQVVFNSKAYQDDDSDGIADLITDAVTLNDRTFILRQNVSQSVKTSTSPEGRGVSSSYDPVTLTTQKVSIPGLYDTDFTYDPRGRITSQTTHTRQTTFSYVDDASGHQITITDPEQHQWTYFVDPMDRLRTVQGPDGGQVRFTYDKNGNMTVLTNPVDIDHKFGFNDVNRNSSYLTPLSGSYSNTYDKDRRLLQTNFPSGDSIFYDYRDPDNPDDKSRLRRIETPQGDIEFTYQCGTKVETITTGTESITYGYDGRLTTSESLSGTLNQSLNYTYNNDFDIAGFTYAGATVSYNYDNDGLLTGAGSFSIARNAGNGLPESVTDGALEIVRTFNGYGEVDDQAMTVGGQGLTGWSLTRDDNGRITAKTETVGGLTSDFAYTYDDEGRLLRVYKNNDLVEEYRYDLNGTRIYATSYLRDNQAKTYSYSDEDHLMEVESVKYDHDQDGFLVTRTDGSDVTSYNYSLRGELLTVTLPDGRVIVYVHDPLGRRIAKKVDGVTVEKYLWQGLTRLLAVYDGADNLRMRFEYADDRMPVAVMKEGVAYYLAYDQVGSLRLVADSAGNVIKFIEYDAFGNILNDSNPIFALPFGFAGGLHDRDIGLVRFGYRDYDPEVGRWTAKDPIGFAGGDTDLYGYVLNDPVNLVDPFGLWNPAGAIAGGIVGGIVGGFGSLLSGNTDAATIATAAIAGVISGALGGAFDVTMGIGAGVGAGLGAAGAAALGANTGGIVGAAIGGGIGGALGALPGLGTAGVVTGTWIGGVWGSAFGFAGEHLYSQLGNNSNPCD